MATKIGDESVVVPLFPNETRDGEFLAELARKLLAESKKREPDATLLSDPYRLPQRLFIGYEEELLERHVLEEGIFEFGPTALPNEATAVVIKGPWKKKQ